MKNIAIALALVAAAALAGCQTPEIQAAKPYEGRYSSSESLTKAAASVEFAKGEQVWLLSASTLKRILKNTEK